MSLQQTITQALQNGNWLTFFIVFWSAAILSLSSCTIIRIPVVIGYIGAAPSSKRKTFLTVVSFVAGIILSYMIIGILLGFVSQFTNNILKWSKFLYYIFAVLLLLAGINLAGLVNFKFLKFKKIEIPKFKKAGFLGAFVFGMIFAFLEAPTCPCCAPALLIIAGLTFFEGKIIYGFLIFLTYALGQSLPILLIGVFMGIIKYGSPMIYRLEKIIKFLGGNILIAIGLYCLLLG